MHERGPEMIVGMPPAVAILAVLPTVAEAQDMAETQGANRGAEAAGSMVFRPCGRSTDGQSGQHNGRLTHARRRRMLSQG